MRAGTSARSMAYLPAYMVSSRGEKHSQAAPAKLESLYDADDPNPTLVRRRRRRPRADPQARPAHARADLRDDRPDDRRPGPLQVREPAAHGRVQIPRRLQRALATCAGSEAPWRRRIFLRQPCAGRRPREPDARDPIDDRDAEERA